MTSKPLLEITVSDLDSVPVVKYKGEVISNKASVSYDWLTRTDKEGKHALAIGYYELDDCGFPIDKQIRESR
jgi:hypothetical protein